MTLKTAQTAENAYFKELSLEFDYSPPWDGVSFTRRYGMLMGTVTKRINAAPSFTFSYMNPRGKYTEDFQVGGHVRVYANLGKTDSLPIFTGMITPGGGLARSGYQIDIHAVGYSALLFRELMHLGTYIQGTSTLLDSLDGWEAGAALREIVAGLTGAPLDESGIMSSYPTRLVGRDFVLSTGFLSRGAIVDSIIDEMVDTDESAGVARPYYWFELPPHRGLTKPVFMVRKFPDLTSSTGVSKTVFWNDEIMASSDNIRTEQCTRCYAASSLDANIYEMYESASAKARFGAWAAPITYPSINRDDLARVAFRYVQARRLPIRVISLDAYSAWDLSPMTVLDVRNGPFGFEGRQAVTELRLPIGNTREPCTVMLASMEEVITEHTI